MLWMTGATVCRRPDGLIVAGALACAAGSSIAALLAQRHLGRLHALSPVDDPRPGPGDGGLPVAVVVPARDEAPRIARCLSSIHAQRPAQMVVADDGSGDATARVAAAMGAEVVAVPSPPPGWMGKPHACWQGAETAARDEWLAFIDADVELRPGALAALVGHAERLGLDAVSPLLRQRTVGAFDSLIVPLAFWQYAVGLPGGAQNASAAVLNGQCLLVRSSAYRAIGGHGHPSVRGSVVEDSALARALAAAGARIALVRGEELGEVWMYEDAAAVRRGFAKNVSGFLAADPGRGALVAAAGMALTGPLGLATASARRRSAAGLTATAVAMLPATAALASRYRASRLPAGLALLHPAAASAMQLIAIESLLRSALGRPPVWKSRRARPAD